MATVVFDLLGTRWLVPWTTVLTAVLLWQPFVLDYPHRLTTTTGMTHWWFAHPASVGWSHLAWAVLVVAIVVAMPARSPVDGAAEGHPTIGSFASAPWLLVAVYWRGRSLREEKARS